MPPSEKLGTVGDPGDTHRLRDRIAAARERQRLRYENVFGVHCNAQADSKSRRTHIRVRREASELLRRAVAKWDLSVRAYERTLAVARSIADLDGSSDVDVQHVAEAMQYRLEPAGSA